MTDDLRFLTTEGAMAAALRAIDADAWGRSPAGPPSGWPDALRSWLASLMGASQPMGLAWGEGLAFFCNDAFAPALGDRAAGALGRPLIEAWPELASTLAESGPEAEFLPGCWSLAASPLRDAAGAVGGILLTRARTEAPDPASAEAHLHQAQRLDAIGQLTGGVAHDFNNLLTPIVGALDLLQRRALGSPRERQRIDGALQAAERARVLVGRLLAFARRQPLQTLPLDLAQLVEGLRNLLVSTVGPKVRVRIDVADALPPAMADPHLLEMALLTLAANAREAMPEGGALSIAVSREEVALAGGPHPVGLAPGTYLRLKVEDSGQGMDAASLGQAAEPFFSTRAPGHDGGLGLSMVQGLALRLGGALGLDSEPGRGTRVTLWLPAARRPATLPSVARSRLPGAGAAALVDVAPLHRLRRP